MYALKNIKPYREFVTIAKAHFTDENGKAVNSPFICSVPQNYSNKNKYPLLVALHGSGSDAKTFHDLWKSVTDSLGFVLLTPQGEKPGPLGIGKNWGENTERSVLNVFPIKPSC
ncbi:hypothetical protein JW935_02905 [candidate division KSB1 bacterium]|nr:hypothetical protein [candidate division KSB1 bacterium]